MKSFHLKTIKTGTLLVLLLLSMQASCTQLPPNPPPEISISWSENVQSVGLEIGTILELVLPVNLSTGYIWETGFYNPSVLKPYGEPDFSSNNTKLGGDEAQMLHFETVGEGETELVLVYRRPFESEDVDPQIFKIDVTVWEAGDISERK